MMKRYEMRITLAMILSMPICLHLFSCSSTTGADDDGMAPAAITDLEVVSTTDTTATLTWTATGDDENEGTAARYELRRADQYITPLAWDDATTVPDLPSPKPAGTTESFTVTGLTPESRNFFALSVFDDEGNTCGCGNCVEAFCFQDAEVLFAEFNLAEAVRERLGLTADTLY